MTTSFAVYQYRVEVQDRRGARYYPCSNLLNDRHSADYLLRQCRADDGRKYRVSEVRVPVESGQSVWAVQVSRNGADFVVARFGVGSSGETRRAVYFSECSANATLRAVEDRQARNPNHRSNAYRVAQITI